MASREVSGSGSGVEAAEEFVEYRPKSSRRTSAKRQEESESDSLIIGVEERAAEAVTDSVDTASEQSDGKPGNRRGKRKDVSKIDVGAPPPAASTTEAKISDFEASLSAGMILATLNGFACNVVGPHAAIEKQEKDLIEQGLSRTLKRVTPSQLSRVSNLLDPLMIVAGLGMWYARVNNLQARQLNASAKAAQESSGISTAVAATPAETLLPHSAKQDEFEYAAPSVIRNGIAADI